MRAPVDGFAIAENLLSRGIAPVAVGFQQKRPIFDDWQHRKYTLETLANDFPVGKRMNVGAMFGPISGNLTDVDLDSPQAIIAAPYFLPRTASIYGRGSKRNSHRLYRCDFGNTSYTQASLAFDNPDASPKEKARIIEIRKGGTAEDGSNKGAQTVWPGSVHESGEEICWEPDLDGEPSQVSLQELVKAVRKTAAAALLAAHWHKGGTLHDASILLGNVLGRAQWSGSQVALFVEAVVKAASDGDLSERKRNAEDGRANGSAGKGWGYPAFKEQWGEKVAKRFYEWLGLKVGEAAKPEASQKTHTDPDEAIDDAAFEAEVERLAKLSIAAYERERISAAKTLSIRASALDTLVRIARGTNGDDGKQGQRLEFPEVVSWPEPVDGAELVEEIIATLTRYVVLSIVQALTVALWNIHAHALEAAEHTPRLHVASPEKRCGKTKLLAVMKLMLPRALESQNITVAALFRAIEMARPTMLMDEVDTFIPENEELRGILNAGYERSGTIIRTVGDDYEPRQFSVWGPGVLAGIGQVPSTIADRSIRIDLARKKKSEMTERLNSRAKRDAVSDLGRKCARWAADNMAKLTGAEPKLPEQMDDRAQDKWRPLMAIAEACRLADRAWQACLAISGAMEADEETPGVMLLGDIKGLFAAQDEDALDFNTDRIKSSILIERLIGLEGRPWRDWHKGKPISDRAVVRLLKRYGIKPDRYDFAPPGSKERDRARGYLRLDFQDAWERYVK